MRIEIDPKLLAAFDRRCRRMGAWPSRVLDKLLNDALDKAVKG